MSQPLPLDEALKALRRDPTHAVRARVDDELTVEVRAVADGTEDAFAHQPTVGELLGGVHWHGDETLDELLTFFTEARRQGGNRRVPEL